MHLQGWTFSVVSRIMAPKDDQDPISGTCEYITLSGKRDFAGMIK